MTNQPPKLKLDHPRLFAVVTGLWAIALVVLLILRFGPGLPVDRWLWVCLSGTVLGFAAMVYVHYSWRAKD